MRGINKPTATEAAQKIARGALIEAARFSLKARATPAAAQRGQPPASRKRALTLPFQTSGSPTWDGMMMPKWIMALFRLLPEPERGHRIRKNEKKLSE